MQSRVLLKLLIISSIWGVSCAQKTKIYDEEVCADLGKDGAHCNHTLKDAPQNYTKEAWDQVRYGWLCMDSQAFSDVESEIQELCLRASCTYVERQQLEEAASRIRALLPANHGAR